MADKQKKPDFTDEFFRGKVTQTVGRGGGFSIGVLRQRVPEWWEFRREDLQEYIDRGLRDRVFSTDDGMYKNCPPSGARSPPSSGPSIVEFHANQRVIAKGGGDVIFTIRTEANWCEITPGEGRSPTTGKLGANTTHKMRVDRTTQFTLVAHGKSGTTRSLPLLITVANDPEPTIVITTNPALLTLPHGGGEMEFTYKAENATGVNVVDNHGGKYGKDLPPMGKVKAHVTKTTTFTFTAYGPGGVKSEEVKVTVALPKPTIEVTTEPQDLELPVGGGSVAFTIRTEHADTLDVTDDRGKNNSKGISAQELRSITATVTESSVFTFTATGPGGTKSVVVEVKVAEPVPEPVPEPAAEPEPLPILTVTVSPDHLPAEGGTITFTVACGNTTELHFAVTAEGPGGEVVREVMVEVNEQAATPTGPDPAPKDKKIRRETKVNGLRLRAAKPGNHVVFSSREELQEVIKSQGLETGPQTLKNLKRAGILTFESPGAGGGEWVVDWIPEQDPFNLWPELAKELGLRRPNENGKGDLATTPQCPKCGGTCFRKDGRSPRGKQRLRCKEPGCKKVIFVDRQAS